MKKLSFTAMMLTIVLVSCNNNQPHETSTRATTSSTQDTMQTVRTDSADKNSVATPAAVFPIKEVMAGYLKLKNALANDNGKAAAAAGNLLLADLGKVDINTLPKTQIQEYMDITDDMKEHSEHIGSNPGKIEHQREHFIMLSKDVMDLVKTAGTGGQTLYKDFCPMADGGKGASWVSELKDIKNPYLGAKMPTCGSVKETLK